MSYRNAWIVDDKYLTPVGQWAAARFPRSFFHQWPLPITEGYPAWCFRVFGFAIYNRFCILDVTVLSRRAWNIRFMGIGLMSPKFRRMNQP